MVFSRPIAAAAMLVTLTAAGTALCAAQTPSHAYPSIADSKVRGLQGMNNSGQIGTATLTQQPDKTTHLILTMKGVPAGKTESAALYRSNDGTCDNLKAKPEVTLSPVVAAKSNTIVKIDRDRLLSGNYFVVVSAPKPVACGHLTVQ